MKDLTMTDMVNIHGGSTFSYYVFRISKQPKITRNIQA